ncbi:recombination regulator RecX [Metaclostridioides mangenotii]|uniref:recombination regulator RecX n=1 Tax=Metaclostridioides mangenotii TaxID=1540 RepID=UPI0028E49140|nr:recombination regulator RecX [Clostridioides mangenotii]
MAIITKLEAQKKNDDRVSIYVDDKYFVGVYKELIYSFNLKKGDSIDEESLKEMLDKEMFIKAKNKAINMLTRSDKSEKTMRDKLTEDFDEHIIDQVVEFLEGYKLIDDNSLAHKLTNKNVHLNKWGKNKIKQNLYTKGIKKEDINDAISDIDDDVEFENAMYLAKKKYAQVNKIEKRKANQKLYQHLSYKGFDYNTVKRVLDKLLNTDEYDM